MKVTFVDGSFEEYEDAPLAAGAEGEVYRSQDKKHAVKLYSPDKAKDSERIRRIDILINDLNPIKDDANWAEFFAWPEKRVTLPFVGFRMRFAQGLKTLEHYILGKSYARLQPEERGWFIGRVATAIKLANAAHRMSSMGLCYPDFSGKNIMVDPFEGRMMLIDCDSLTVPNRLPPTVQGTTWFRAPEIVGHKVLIPSIQTDRHALAVILYQWLLLWHPLVGNKHFDPDPITDDTLRFGEQALYIEHPTDTSNRASKQILKSQALGPELEKLFRTAFVDGLHNADKRPLPFQWQQALYHTYDQIVPCASQSCDWRFFVATCTPRLACPKCGQPLVKPPTLPFVYLFPHRGTTSNPDDYQTDESRAHYIVGWPDKYLHQWHIRPDAHPMYTDPRHVPDPVPQAVFKYDQRTMQWYLKNLAQHDMYFRLPTDTVGQWRKWPSNASIPLSSGMSLQLGIQPTYFRASVTIARVG